MKKLITLATVISTFLIGATAVTAQHAKSKGNNPAGYYAKNIPHSNGHYNRRGVYIYHSTKIVRKWNGKYRNIYEHRIFPNGRKKTRLIQSVKIRSYRQVHRGARTYYETGTVYRGWRSYRVTYKVTKYPNGRITKKVVKMRRIYA